MRNKISGSERQPSRLQQARDRRYAKKIDRQADGQPRGARAADDAAATVDTLVPAAPSPFRGALGGASQGRRVSAGNLVAITLLTLGAVVNGSAPYALAPLRPTAFEPLAGGPPLRRGGRRLKQAAFQPPPQQQTPNTPPPPLQRQTGAAPLPPVQQQTAATPPPPIQQAGNPPPQQQAGNPPPPPVWTANPPPLQQAGNPPPAWTAIPPPPLQQAGNPPQPARTANPPPQQQVGNPPPPAWTASPPPQQQAGSPPPPAVVSAPPPSRSLAPPPPSGPSSVGASSTVTAGSVQTDLTATMVPRDSFPGMLSGRSTGNNNVMSTWTPALFNSFARGIQTAQQFFPSLDANTLQTLIVSEASQESTGNYALNVGSSDPGAGMGLIQVTPQSVMKDFQQYGVPVHHPDGSVMVDPAGTVNLADPGQNIAIYAWYASNVVAAGESLAEKLTWGNQGTAVAPIYANVMYNWFAGPHNDVNTNPTPFQDYYNRVHDYYVGAGFGTTAQFNTLMYNTTLSLAVRSVQTSG